MLSGEIMAPKMVIFNLLTADARPLATLTLLTATESATSERPPKRQKMVTRVRRQASTWNRWKIILSPVRLRRGMLCLAYAGRQILPAPA